MNSLTGTDELRIAGGEEEAVPSGYWVDSRDWQMMLKSQLPPPEIGFLGLSLSGVFSNATWAREAVCSVWAISRGPNRLIVQLRLA